MIGRKEELETLQGLLESKEAEFLAVTGRRRVGKTFLIDTFYADRICFKMTGIQNQGSSAQLLNFAAKLSEYDDDFDVIPPENWQWAFINLKKYLKKLPTDRKQVIFIDELPWVASTDKSFVQMLAHLWNDYISRQSHFILVICGSATSWIVHKIIDDPGGMHNRITRRIHVEPFNLLESRQFLHAQGVMFTPQEVAKAYMALGGIPYYLRYFKSSDTFMTGIHRMCLKPSGGLFREYNSLYAALFQHSDVHKSIVEALASKPFGLARSALKSAALVKSNSSFDRAIEELELSGFIARAYPYGRKKRGVIYRLIDEFSIFYHRYRKGRDVYDPAYWPRVFESQSFKIWLGYAFEGLARKHAQQIKEALGIGGVLTTVSTLNIPRVESERGCQIDLLIDRQDDAINLCEMKFHDENFVISEDYHHKLHYKKHRFVDFTKTRKRIILTMVTNHPVERNKWFLGTVDATVLLEDLFK